LLIFRGLGITKAALVVVGAAAAVAAQMSISVSDVNNQYFKLTEQYTVVMQADDVTCMKAGTAQLSFLSDLLRLS